MPTPTDTYDLVMLLDPQAEPTSRERIVSETRAAIEGKGELVRHDEWGERALAYPIERHTSAEYHLMQFHVGDVELLSGLDHTLRITDGLLRFRIVKLKPGVPEAPDMRAASRRAEPGATTGSEGPAAEAPADAAPAPEAPAAEAPAGEAPAAEAPAEEAPAAEVPAEAPPAGEPEQTTPAEPGDEDAREASTDEPA
jgi:small subunit ribosomal protein S6